MVSKRVFECFNNVMKQCPTGRGLHVSVSNHTNLLIATSLKSSCPLMVAKAPQVCPEHDLLPGGGSNLVYCAQSRLSVRQWTLHCAGGLGMRRYAHSLAPTSAVALCFFPSAFRTFERLVSYE
jgi:hypothetical protein